ncbi:unnamed protein product [Alopecurus aequalis]
MVRPMPMPPAEEIHLTPWDLPGICYSYMTAGLVLPKPTAGGEMSLVDTLAASLARVLGRYYNFAGRLAVVDHGEGTVTIPLRCTGEGAELVHAVAPGLAVADVVGGSLLYSPSLSALFPADGVSGAHAALDSSLPVLFTQVTELADGVFIALAANHAVCDGVFFFELFKAWSSINRGDGLALAPAPVHRRWFVDTSPVPIPIPLSILQQVVGQPSKIPPPPVQDGFFTFSSSSVRKLKAKANAEIPAAAGTISSLQAVAAHLWRGVTRARRLPPGEETCCYMVIGLRGRMRGIPLGYVGNALAVTFTTGCTAGEILGKGLGWTAWQLNRVVESFDEEEERAWLDRWAREPEFPDYRGGGLVIAGSQRYDAFGNDFGWGKPLALRHCPGERKDGLVTACQGPDQEGSMSLDVALAPETMERLVADKEFMEAVLTEESGVQSCDIKSKL